MTENELIRETVGVFDDYKSLDGAVQDLQTVGIGRHQISVLGSEIAVKERFGEPSVKTEMLRDNPDAPRSPNIKREELGVAQGILVGGGTITGVVAAVIAAGGVAVPGVITAAAIGGAGGAGVGGILAKLLGDKYAKFFQHQIDQGGLLLWVNTPDETLEYKARAILEKYGAREIGVHDIPANELGENKTIHPPQLFGETFVKLDHIVESYESIVSDDSILHDKIDDVLQSLKDTAAKGEAVTQEQAKAIVVEMDEASSYAQDMAEEQQRLIAETQAEGNGKQEKESEQYISLAHDLNELASEYQRNIMKSIAA